MIPKILSTAVLAVATTLTAPLVLADRDDRNEYRKPRAHQVEERYSRHDHGQRHGWHKHRYNHKHGRHQHQHYTENREYYNYDQRNRRNYEHHHTHQHSSSAAPIIFGSVIGGVVGHEIGYGNPGHTAVGAVIGTMIGYDIALHRRLD